MLKIINACVFIICIAFMTSIMGNAAHAGAPTRNCGREMQLDNKKFLRLMKAQNFSTRAATSNKEASDRLITWLKDVNKDVIRHEKAHKKAAGKWGNKIFYFYYKWKGINYRTAGCMTFKKDIPLNVMVKAGLAPVEPSSQDRKIARMAKKFAKIKQSRKKCKTYKHSKKMTCLKKYEGFKWLDKYPLNE